MRSGCRVFEHTADIGLTVWGETLEDLFAAAADGLVRVALDRSGRRAETGRPPTRRMAVKVPPAPDLEALLVDWLNWLVFLLETEGQYPCACDIEINREGASFTVTGEVALRPIPAGRLATAVKGATYHGLMVTRSKQGQCRARVILDV